MTKLEFLKEKATALGVILPDDIARYLAALHTADVRELEGLLNRLIAYASLTRQSLSLALAMDVVLRSGFSETIQ